MNPIINYSVVSTGEYSERSVCLKVLEPFTRKKSTEMIGRRISDTEIETTYHKSSKKDTFFCSVTMKKVESGSLFTYVRRGRVGRFSMEIRCDSNPEETKRFLNLFNPDHKNCYVGNTEDIIIKSTQLSMDRELLQLLFIEWNAFDKQDYKEYILDCIANNEVIKPYLDWSRKFHKVKSAKK